MSGADGAGRSGTGLALAPGQPAADEAAAAGSRAGGPPAESTPALRGHPGGIAAPAPPRPAVEAGPRVSVPKRGRRRQAGPSVWQQAVSAWREAGVEWQAGRPHEKQPHEKQEDRQDGARQESARPESARQDRAGRTAAEHGGRPAGHRGIGGGPDTQPIPVISVRGVQDTAPAPAGRTTARPDALPPAAQRTRRRVRAAVAAAVAVVVVAGGIAVAAAVAGYPGRPAGLIVSSRTAGQAAAGAAAFPAPPGPGVLPSLGGVAASGQTVVAIGSRPGTPAPRPVFLYSTDGGATWQPAVVRAGGGRASATPVMIAGGHGAWLALGVDTAWTSPDGRTWTRRPGIAPALPGDRVLALARTGSGFVAIGERVQPGAREQRRGPVLWTSSDGLTWHRRRPAGLAHAAGGGQVGALRWVAARGNVVLIGAELARTVRRGGRHAATATVRSAGVWRSTDGGATWSWAGVPDGQGATPWLAGLGATRSAFAAVRPGRAAGRGDAVVYTSVDGRRWRFAGRLTGRHHAGLQIASVVGNANGIVAAGSTGGHRVAFISANGRSWHRVAGLGAASSATVAAAVAGPGRTVVAAGAASAPLSLAGPAGVRPFLLVAGKTARRVSAGAINGGPADVTVRAVASGVPGRVAVGSADGFAAIWSAPGGGRWTWVPALPPGQGAGMQLDSVVDGGAGWLAVGGQATPAGAAGAAAATAGAGGAGIGPAWSVPGQSPLIMTSPQGRDWSPARGAAPLAAAGTALAQAAHGPSGYVVVGSETTAGKITAAAWVSPGLRTWTPAAVGGAAHPPGPDTSRMLAVSAARAGFVAAGSEGTSPAVWTSPDGRTWRLVTLPVPRGAASAALTQVAATGGRVVALGTESVRGRETPFAAVSADGGRTWRETTLPHPAGPATVTALTPVPGGFVAAGERTDPASGSGAGGVVWWTFHGQTWHPFPAAGLSGPGGRRLTAFGVAGHLLTGTGYSVVPGGTRPLTWVARLR